MIKNNQQKFSSASSTSFLPVGGQPVTSTNAILGASVQRGPDYEYGNDQDGGSGKEGVIINIVRIDYNKTTVTTSSSSNNNNNNNNNNDNSLLAKVRWNESAVVGLYRIGPRFFDLSFSEVMIPPHQDGLPVSLDEESGSSVIIGAAVSRNPEHWTWGDQDGPRGGHIISAEAETGWVVVKWGDDSVFRYRAGGKSEETKGKYDLLYGERWNKKMTSTPVFAHGQAILNESVNSNLSSSAAAAAAAAAALDAAAAAALDAANAQTSENKQQKSSLSPLASPTSSNKNKSLPKEADPVSVDNFRVGARVIRGPNWREDIYGAQDIEFGGWGVLRSCDAKEKFIRVKWANGMKRNYRAGIDGAHDLQYDCNPLSPIRVTASPKMMTMMNNGKQLFPSSSSDGGGAGQHHQQDPSLLLLSLNGSGSKKAQRRLKELDDLLMMEGIEKDPNMNNNNFTTAAATATSHYNFSAAPSNVILASNEARRKQLERLVFLAKASRRKQKQQMKMISRRTSIDHDQSGVKKNDDDVESDDDDDFIFDVTSIATTDATDRDDDDLDLRSELFTFDVPGALRTFTDDDDRTSNFDNDDDDLSSVVSDFSCFRPLEPPQGFIPHHQQSQRRELEEKPREHLLNHDQDDDHHQQQQQQNRNQNSYLNDNTTGLAAAPPRPPQPPPAVLLISSSSTSKSEITELCYKCKTRPRLYGAVPCGCVILCPVCVGQIVLEMNSVLSNNKNDTGDDNKASSVRENKSAANKNDDNDDNDTDLADTKKQKIVDSNGTIHCLVCKKPVEMLIKIFR